MNDINIILLKYILARNDVPDILIQKVNWKSFYDFSIKHSILGQTYYLLEHLREDTKNKPCSDLIIDWLATTERISMRNLEVNHCVHEIFKFFESQGYRCCLLKGQGNAHLYQDSNRRMPGDIDVWVDTDRDSITNLVHQSYPTVEEEFQHIKYPIFPNVEVEVHYFPSRFNNPYFNRKLKRYYETVRKQQFSHFVDWNDNGGCVCVPTNSFNRIYQMTHIMYHFFNEGIGLRQIIDYYYLLKQGFSEEEKLTDVKIMVELNMVKFTSGVMWILTECLGLESEYCIVKPNEKTGKIIFKEILASGNFGLYDLRYSGKRTGIIQRNMIDLYRIFHFALIFPSEVLFRPYAKIINQKWKVKHWFRLREVKGNKIN